MCAHGLNPHTVTVCLTVYAYMCACARVYLCVFNTHTPSPNSRQSQFVYGK